MRFQYASWTFGSGKDDGPIQKKVSFKTEYFDQQHDAARQELKAQQAHERKRRKMNEQMVEYTRNRKVVKVFV